MLLTISHRIDRKLCSQSEWQSETNASRFRGLRKFSDHLFISGFVWGTGKSWNSILAFSRTGKRQLALENSINLLNSRNKMKRMTDSKDNTHWDLGSEWVNANFRVLKKSIWKSPENLFLEEGASVWTLKLFAKWDATAFTLLAMCWVCNIR